MSFWQLQWTGMTLPTKLWDRSRQWPRHFPHVGQRSRPRGRPPDPAQTSDLVGRRLALALGEIRRAGASADSGHSDWCP
jgi:hypothetical protein